jgi:hypothetical protein
LFLGELLTINGTNEPELYWALRGGGGGLFVIVTEFKVRLVKSPPLVTSFTSSWYPNATKLVMQRYQSLVINADSFNISNNTFFGMDVNNGYIKVFMSYFGTDMKELNRTVSSLLESLPSPTETSTDKQDWLDFVYERSSLINRSGDSRELLLNNLTYPRYYFKAKHLFYDQPISNVSIDQLIDQLSLGDGYGQINVEFGPWDGYVSQIPVDETAFPYRNSKFGIQFMVRWDDKQHEQKQLDWLNKVYSSIYNDSTKHSYINYIDRDIPDWMEAYYHVHQKRLSNIQQIYDKNNRFCFERTIQ